jgi:hypothetical protein
VCSLGLPRKTGGSRRCVTPSAPIKVEKLLSLDPKWKYDIPFPDAATTLPGKIYYAKRQKTMNDYAGRQAARAVGGRAFARSYTMPYFKSANFSGFVVKYGIVYERAKRSKRVRAGTLIQWGAQAQ